MDTVRSTEFISLYMRAAGETISIAENLICNPLPDLINSFQAAELFCLGGFSYPDFHPPINDIQRELTECFKSDWTIIALATDGPEEQNHAMHISVTVLFHGVQVISHRSTAALGDRDQVVNYFERIIYFKLAQILEARSVN